MLEVRNLEVKIGEKTILNKLSLSFEAGKNYCILGKNGSGKSSLAMAIAGNPKYEVSSGEILLDGEALQEMSPDERNKAWIFLTFQNIPEIPGIKLFEFLKSIHDAQQEKPSSFLEFKKIIDPLLIELEIDREFLWRDLNVGFSGGEKRKIEVLQIKLLNPRYIILDEIDSGLDVNALKQVSELLSSLKNKENSFIVITHVFKILEYLPSDEVYVLDQGSVHAHGGEELIEKIKVSWF